MLPHRLTRHRLGLWAPLACCASLASLASQSQTTEPISVRFVHAEAHEALMGIATDAGISLVVDQRVTGKVTAVLANMPWRDALHMVAQELDAQIVDHESHGLLAIRPAFSTKPAPQPPSIARPAAPATLDPGHLIRDIPAINPDGTVNVVVEIPTGTAAKWEVDKSDGRLRWEQKNGVPRVVKYLGYPGNYGMVPRTHLPKSEGGDGDPLDVIILGRPKPRGSVVSVRLLGVLELLDGGERDDKLIAVSQDSLLAKARDLESLQDEFPGITNIVETWFTNYKGPGKMESKGFAGRTRAGEILHAAVAAFEH